MIPTPPALRVREPDFQPYRFMSSVPVLYRYACASRTKGLPDKVPKIDLQPRCP